MVKYLLHLPLAVRKALDQIFAFRGFWRCGRGATAVEFALCAPILLYFMFGSMEYGLILTMDSLLEGGVRQGARCAITGNGSAASAQTAPICAGGSAAVTDRTSAIIAAVNKATGGFLTLTASNISMLVYPSFVAINGEPYTDVTGVGSYVSGDPYTDLNGNGVYDGPQAGTAITDGGASGAIVLYTVQACWTIITPGLSLFAQSSAFLASAPVACPSGNFKLQAEVVVRNEPYSS